MYLIAIAPDLLCSLSGRFSAELAEFMPEMVQRLPVTGQIYGVGEMNPETLAGLTPDIVIDIGEPKETAGDDMDAISKALSVPALHIAATLFSAPDAFRSLGRLLGRQAKGEELAIFCEQALAESMAAMTVAAGKPLVLYCLGAEGTNVMAAGSFQSEAIDIMTNNAAVVNNPSARGTGNETDLEQIFVWNPEIIIFAPDSIYGTAGANRLWQQLPAIQNGNFFRTPAGPYNWLTSPPSINRYMGLLWLGKLLYNADYDLYAKAHEYYRLFYSYDLSREQYNRLTAGSFR
jgi:iron complex transport system substrate-binding protein